MAIRLAALRAGAAGLVALAALSLSGCTTVEGTNALTSVRTFEREVMTETLKGVGVVPRQEKALPDTARSPLVIPKDGQTMPSPTEEAGTDSAALPKDSNVVQIDTTGLSDADLRRLRNARVVDLRSVSGRPLTESEARQLTARMQQAKPYSGPRPLVIPPDEYFTATADGKQLVCLAGNGDLVSLTDPACPPEIRRALQKK